MRTCGRWAAWTLPLLLAHGAAQAAQVRIPAPQGAAGAARVAIRLVTTDGKPVIAWAGNDLITTYTDLPLSTDQLVTLAAQSQIALPGGAPTYYDIAITTPVRSERVRVQVPDLPGVQELRALVAAAPLAPGQISAGLLLPGTDGAAAGWQLILNGALAATWSPATGCAALGCLADGPLGLGTAGQVLTMAPGGTAWIWAAPTITGLAAVATSGLYNDLAGRPILGSAAATAASAYATAAAGAAEWVELFLAAPAQRPVAGALVLADIPYAGTLTGVALKCRVAPTLSALVVDVRRAADWGGTQTTVLTAPLSLAAGVAPPETTAAIAAATLTAGDQLGAYITTLDSGGTAVDCGITLSITRSP